MSTQYDANKIGQLAVHIGGLHTLAGLNRLYANVAPGSGVPTGSTAYTSDVGMVEFDGTTWGKKGYYLGFVATRGHAPTTYNAGAKNSMSRSRHIAMDNIA